MSQEIGKCHVEALERYLQGLKLMGAGLPSRGGKVNISAVATACGFNREVLYQNPHCKRLVDEAATALGLRGLELREEQTDPEKVKLERRVTQLEQQNSALVAEVYELRRQLMKLRHVEEMLETGRRVIF